MTDVARCGLTDRIPPTGEERYCATCDRTLGRSEVLRCRLKGLEQEQRCPQLGELDHSEHCRSGSGRLIPVQECLSGAVPLDLCVMSLSAWSRLGDAARSVVACCETCPQRPLPAISVEPPVEVVTISADQILPPMPGDVSIIITCGPGYDRWLDTAWRSASSQGRGCDVVIVFDRCPVPSRYAAARHVAVEHGNVQLSRQAGMAATTGRSVLFLDADDQLPEGFAARAWDQLTRATAADPRIAGIYPAIEYRSEDLHRQVSAFDPPEWDRSRFERENYIACTTLVWRHALEVSWLETVGHDRIEDWHTWSQLVRDGWQFQRGRELTLICRKRSDGMLASQVRDYSRRYSMHEAPLTVFIPLSGRATLWPALRDWLQLLPSRCRLVLCDSSGDVDFGWLIRSEQWTLADVRIYSHAPHSRPGLAEEDRTDPAVSHSVSLAVAAIYNRFAQECGTELALILEDDILPAGSPSAVIDELLDGFSERTAAVSGVYFSRLHRSEQMLAWSSIKGKQLMPIDRRQLSDSRYLSIAGAGFGCLLVRRSALRAAPHAVPPGQWYDPWFFARLATLGLSCRLATGVICDHRAAK